MKCLNCRKKSSIKPFDHSWVYNGYSGCRCHGIGGYSVVSKNKSSSSEAPKTSKKINKPDMGILRKRESKNLDDFHGSISDLTAYEINSKK